MRYYIAADGGGTKLQAILYDEEFRIIKTARSCGVNSNFRPEADIIAEMQGLAEELIPEGISEIERVDISIVGSAERLLEALKARCSIRAHNSYGEGQAALAAAGALYGVVAQAGTGSDAFLVQPDGCDTVGGWGAVLGDEGSGYDLGLRTLKAAIYACDGRGPQTMLLDMLLKEWQMSNLWEMVQRLVRNSDSRRLVASATHLTAEAAKLGDEVAIDLYRQAAHALSLQVLTVIKRHGSVWEGPIVASGGVWKGCGRMFEAFCEDIRQVYPDAAIIRTFADPVVGCAIRQRLLAGEDLEELRDVLEERFQPFFIKND